MNANFLRRGLVRAFIGLHILAALWTFVGVAVAGGADSTTQGSSLSAMDGLAWMNIRDSSRVPLSDYMLVTDHGSVADPLSTALTLVLGLEFIVFMVIMVIAIWTTGFILSFGWLEWLGKPFGMVGDRVAEQTGTPMMMTAAASIGALFVAWFIVRGFYAKATLQVVTMLAVGLFGAVYLSDPMAGVLSPEGLLVQGRDVGISVAAGLNGNSTPDAGAIVSGMNGTLADNFVRHPLQVWNFGHVVDESPSCRAAWSSGVLAGNESQVATGLRACGDSYAYAKTGKPSLGQIGTGLVLLIFGSVLSLFLSFLAIKIFLAALSSIFHAMLAIFGFAAGGFIYGPTQILLVRSVVGMCGDAISMVAFTIFLGGYALVLDSVFRAAPDSGMAVIFVGGMLLISSFVLLRRLDHTILGHQQQIAEQIRATLAGKSSAGGGGAVDGLQQAGLRYSLSPGQLGAAAMRGLTTLHMININPVTSWLYRRPNPFTYFSKEMQEMNYLNYELLMGRVPEATAESWMGRLTQGKNAHDAAARAAVEEFGGLNPRAAAAAATNVFALGGDGGDVTGAMRVAGFSQQMTANAVQAYLRVTAAAEKSSVTYDPLARAAVAVELADTARGFPAPERAAYIAQMQESASLFQVLAPRPLYPNIGAQGRNFVRDLEKHWDKPFEDFKKGMPPDRWGTVSEDTRQHVGSRIADELHQASEKYAKTKSVNDLAELVKVKNRGVNLDLMLSNSRVGPFTT
ncbi:hypothetical protein OG563_07045 [Nocardia vinacea]|uniref:Uncharacterized protein n=1 Tax=Nocardia vinacea TaxID=96468 RepID=A0ABZ1YXL1_9NOCA|nr:hypothetical protein [Nocardia vinacea]